MVITTHFLQRKSQGINDQNMAKFMSYSSKTNYKGRKQIDQFFVNVTIKIKINVIIKIR